MNSAIEPTAAILDCSQEAYRKDPLPVPSLSQSIAHTLLTESPLHAWAEHPRLGNLRKPSTKAMDAGTILHKLVLGKGADVEIIQADSYRTKLAQEIRDRAIEQRRTPILEREYAVITGALEQIQANVRAYGIELSGESEVPVKWAEQGSLGPVLCRGMIDHVLMDRGIIYDVKKTQSAHPKACGRAAANYGMALQYSAYTSAVAKLRPDFEGRIDFVFVFIEIEPPYAVFACRPNGMLRELGDMQWNRAVRLWEHCLATNNWPGYGGAGGIGVLEAPSWAITDELVKGDGNE
jgi:hypothetical protein